MAPQLDCLIRFTDRAIRCAQNNDIAGVQACLVKRRAVLEYIYGTGSTIRDASRDGKEKIILNKLLQKDDELRKQLLRLKTCYLQEADSFQSMKKLTFRYSGSPPRPPKFIDTAL